MTVFPTPMIAQLGQAMRTRFYSAKLEGLSDQAAFEEIVRTILETYEEAYPRGDNGK
jgi:energy-converting hydrogenase Eha subunit A